MRILLILLLLSAPALAAALTPGDPVPDFTLTDQDGRRVRMQDFRGKVVVLSFFYRTCPEPTMCPQLMQRLKQAWAEIRRQPGGEKARMLAVTLDPQKDTPQALASYAKAQGLKSPEWRLLTGRDSDVRAVSGWFGVAYFPQKNGTVGHNMGTAVIGPDGRYRKLFAGSGWDPSAVAQAAAALLK